MVGTGTGTWVQRPHWPEFLRNLYAADPGSQPETRTLSMTFPAWVWQDIDALGGDGWPPERTVAWLTIRGLRDATRASRSRRRRPAA